MGILNKDIDGAVYLSLKDIGADIIPHNFTYRIHEVVKNAIEKMPVDALTNLTGASLIRYFQQEHLKALFNPGRLSFYMMSRAPVFGLYAADSTAWVRIVMAPIHPSESVKAVLQTLRDVWTKEESDNKKIHQTTTFIDLV